jgi:hypothetical protein
MALTQQRGERMRPLPTTVAILALLAALLALPLALAPRAEAFVYWANGERCDQAGCTPSAIGRANLDGTGVIQRFIKFPLSGASFPAIGPQPPHAIAVDAEHIYWTTANGVIGRASLDGTGVDHRFITRATAVPGSHDIAVDAHHVYWSDTSRNAIGRANLDGTGVDPDFITTPSPAGDPSSGSPLSIAVDAEYIYWTPQPTFPDAILAIGRANLDGTGVDQRFITRGPPTSGVLGDIAVDASHIYWTEDGGVARANLDGSGVDETFIHVDASSLAVDAAHVYLATSSPSPTAAPRAPVPDQPPAGVIGRASLSGTVDTGFRINTVSLPPGIAVNFSLGKLKKDKNKGTAKLTVEVPVSGKIALSQTKKLKGSEVHAEAAGEVQLSIQPHGRAKKKLAHKGKVKVKAEVTYTPDGGEPDTQTTGLKLIKRG